MCICECRCRYSYCCYQLWDCTLLSAFVISFLLSCAQSLTIYVSVSFVISFLLSCAQSLTIYVSVSLQAQIYLTLFRVWLDVFIIKKFFKGHGVCARKININSLAAPTWIMNLPAKTFWCSKVIVLFSKLSFASA